MKSFFLIISLFWVSISNGQVLDNFSGHWTGLENLDSPSMNYDNRNISIIISEGGDREGYFIYTSSCDFLYNEDLSWSYHYFGFNKDTGQIAFLRRFITPLGLLGYEELTYEIIDWSTEFFVAEYISNDGITFHQLRVSINYLDIHEPLPNKVELSKNFPNPFNPSTRIEFQIEENYYVSIQVYGVKGQLVETLLEKKMFKGKHSINWHAKNNAAGVYFIVMKIADSIKSQKVILLK